LDVQMVNVVRRCLTTFIICMSNNPSRMKNQRLPVQF